MKNFTKKISIFLAIFFAFTVSALAYTWTGSTSGNTTLPTATELQSGGRIKAIHMQGFRNGLIDLNNRAWLKNGSSSYYNGGNVGIGTTSPQEKLHINGSVRGNVSGALRISTGNGYVDIGPQNSSWSHFYTDKGRYYFNTGITVDTGNIGSYNENLNLQTSGNTRMTILNSNGNVGIGTTSPSKKLDVAGDINFTGNLYKNGTLFNGGASAINDLSDAKTDSTSVFLGNGAGVNDDGSDNYNTAVGINALKSNTIGLSNTANGYEALYSNTTGHENTANGFWALRSNTTGYQNIANGYKALYSNTTGHENTANGSWALYSNTTGRYNTANGYEALYFNTTGHYNTANGYGALDSNTTGNNNTANGMKALSSNTTGHYNTANGYRSLDSNTTGNSNTANGNIALSSNTTGSFNVANGHLAGAKINSDSTYDWNNKTSSKSVYLGYDTRASADGDTNEIVIGAEARGNGSNSVTFGNDSITKTLLKGNVGIGTTSPSQKLTVSGNTYATGYGRFDGGVQVDGRYAILADNGMHITYYPSNAHYGYFAGKRNDGKRGFYLGYGNGSSVVNLTLDNANRLDITGGNVYMEGKLGIGTTSPSKKLDVHGDINFTGDLYKNGTLVNLGGGGASAINDLSDAKTDSSSVFLGNGAGVNDEGNNTNIAIGINALYSNTTGFRDTANGYQSLYSNTTGILNTANGYQSLYSNTTGGANTANGFRALSSNTTGGSNTANGSRALSSNTTGHGNTANGFEALSSNTTGKYNTVNGDWALYSNTIGSYNVANGYEAGLRINSDGTYNYSNKTSSKSVYLGYDTRAKADGDTNEIVIGAEARGNGSNTATIGNINITDNYFNGKIHAEDFIYTSDRRLKKNIKTIDSALDKILKLKGVEFNWKKNNEKNLGLIAQDVEKVFPELVVTEKDGEKLKAVKYGNLVAPLIEAVKEQQKEIKELRKEIEELKYKK